jgi:CBS domain-containing protein
MIQVKAETIFGAQRTGLERNINSILLCERAANRREGLSTSMQRAPARAVSLHCSKEQSMRTRDVMVPTVLTVTSETTVEEAAQPMINHRISGIPVMDGERGLVGIITEGDLLRRAETGTKRRPRGSGWFSLKSRMAVEYVKMHAKRVGDVMTQDAVTVDELTSFAVIADLMASRQIKRRR